MMLILHISIFLSLTSARQGGPVDPWIILSFFYGCLSYSGDTDAPCPSPHINRTCSYSLSGHSCQSPMYILELLGHSRTVPGCQTCPTQTLCLSIPCTIVTVYTQTLCLSIPGTIVTWTLQDCPWMSDLPHTNPVSEYVVYHSYSDTPGLSLDV